MSKLPGLGEYLSTRSVFTSIRQHQRKELSLEAGIIQCVVIWRTAWFERSSHLGGLGLLPTTAGSSHEVGFYIDCSEPKGISSQVFVEVVVDKRPVKRCIKTYEHHILPR